MKISNEEIYNLREQGLTYEAIAKYFRNQGKEVCLQTIYNRCKKIYEEKEEKEPRATSKSGITDEEIYSLREQGLTYEAIAEYFKNQGKEVCLQTISNRCKRIYQDKKKKTPKANHKTGIQDNQIYELREQGATYEAIVEYFANQGKKIPLSSIYNRCKRIYQEKGKEEPKVKRRAEEPKTGITDEEIYDLREKGLTYEAIAEYFASQGKKISKQAVNNRYKRIYKEKEEQKAKKKTRKQKDNSISEGKRKSTKSTNNKDLAKAIMNLMVTRKASLEQIKKMAEVYEVNLEEVFDNYKDER